MMSLIPLPYRIALLIAYCAAVYAVGWLNGNLHVKHKWDASRAAIQAAEAKAVDARLADNARLATQQAGFNAAITKAKNEDLAPALAAIAADRVRIGPALCPRFAAATETAGTGRSDDADHVAAGIRDQAERDLKALELDVASALATGRTAQAFIKTNGLAP